MKLFDTRHRACYYFQEIANIPHGSRNEKALSDYIVSFAHLHHLKCVQDEMYNVVIYKPASKGYEEHAPLMLQAHIDMVCEKNKNVEHDFEKDPIQLIEKDGWLYANGTTLGADDGQGVAYMLAILEDETLAHPALECVFTTMEEIGLDGALALDKHLFASRRLINLDGGGEEVTMISSAGGECVIGEWSMKKVPVEGVTYQLSIRGLSGGHSGGEIDKEKGNANKLAIRMLYEAYLNEIDVHIVSMDGGLKDNAIPRECDLVFVSSSSLEDLETCLKHTEKEIQDELAFSDAGFYAELKTIETCSQALSLKDSQDFLTMLFLLPNGFKARSMAIEGLTLTSLNFGVASTKDDLFTFTVSIRSAIESAIDDLERQILAIASLFNVKCHTEGRYPSWNFVKHSPIREALRKAVKDVLHKDLVELAAHGGCECGVFKAMYEDMDIVGVGPIAKYIHTPQECLDIASFIRVYDLLIYLISIL